MSLSKPRHRSLHPSPSGYESPVFRFEPSAKLFRVGTVQPRIATADNSQVVGKIRETNEPGDAVVHVRLLEAETVEVYDREIEISRPRSDQNVSGIVIAMEHAVIVLRKSKARKLFEQHLGIGAMANAAIQQSGKVVVVPPETADIIRVPQASAGPILDARDRVRCTDPQMEQLLRVRHGTPGF